MTRYHVVLRADNKPTLYASDGGVSPTRAAAIPFRLKYAKWTARNIRANAPTFGLDAYRVRVEPVTHLETCWCGCGSTQPHQEAIEEYYAS